MLVKGGPEQLYRCFLVRRTLHRNTAEFSTLITTIISYLRREKCQHITYSDVIALYIKHFKYFRGWLWNILLWCKWITWKSLEKTKQLVSTTVNQNTNDILLHLVPKLRAMPFSWTVNVYQIAKTTLFVYTNLQKNRCDEIWCIFGIVLLLLYNKY